MQDPRINEIFAAYSRDMIDFAKRGYQITLDSSPDSIELIEDIAERIHRSLPRSYIQKLWKKDISDEEFDAVCKMLGGYVGEVYRANHGGNWGINEEWETYGIILDDGAWIFPIAKAAKRVRNGSDDSLLAFYRVFTEPGWKEEGDEA